MWVSFYYAGHGVQIKGRNFLIPVGADIQREDEVTYNAFDAGRLLEKMEAARSRINIVILDACRNNPFTRSFRSASQGLAQMEAPVGSYVAFATAPATVASDGNSGNGLYTQHLLEAMRAPGLKIEEVFKKVRVKVMADSEGKQVPWDNSSLTGDFYFVPPQSVATQGAPAALSQSAPPEPAPPSADDKTARADVESAPAAAEKRSSGNKVLVASIPPRNVTPPARPPAPKVDPATSEANVALYKKGMDAKGKGDLAAAGEAFGVAAEAGHPGAGYEMGLLLKIGRKPITQDLARAHQYFLKSAEQKNLLSQYELAQMFAQGVGTKKNCSQATKWALKSAQAGSADAAVLLGELYRADCDGAKNPSEAARWLRMAADQGVANAQFSLGVLYMNGDGVPKDANEARKWLTAAAGKGNTSARFYLERIGK
ncbi:MAG: SEL1-like repeat protein [Betaproteobacteria bacterium]|nr:SEL1-like repeat protein [Betaproteobacteria bacterium]